MRATSGVILEEPGVAALGSRDPAAKSDWAVTLGLSALFGASLLVFALGYLADVGAVRLAGLLGLLFFGVGVAPVQLCPRTGLATRLGVGGVVGLSVMVLGGALMVLVPVWHPVVAAVAFGVIAVALHGLACRRALAGVRRADVLATLDLRGRIGVDASAACSVVGTGLWVGVAVTNGRVVPGVGGFLTTISVLWYAGLVLLLAAIVLARGKSEAHAAFAVVSLVAAFTATPALVYGMPREQSAAKHVELVQQILHSHRLNRGSGIYEAYSAFFAGIAWVCDLARVRDSIGIATWWPFALAFVRIAELRFFFGRLLTSRYRIWAAVTFAVLVDSISADYFSPQSVGFVLGVGVYALALGGTRSAPRAAAAGPGQAPALSAEPAELGERWTLALVAVAALALAVTHELSPYVVGGVLVVLTISRAVRPSYVAVVCLVPAGLWALLNRHVLTGLTNLSDLGNLSNFAPPQTIATPGLRRLPIVGYTSHALLLGLLVAVALACVGLARTLGRRQSQGFFVSAGVGIFFIAVNPYGNEGIFRAALFGIPWLTALAFLAVRSHPQRWLSGVFGVVTVGLLATFLVSSFGLDNATVMRRSDLAAFRVWEARALGTGDLLNLTYGDIPSTVASAAAMSRLVTWSTLVAKPTLTAPPTAGDAASLAQRYAAFAAKKTKTPASELYALWSPAAATYGVNYGLETLEHAQEWRDRLMASPAWRVVYHAGGTYLFQVVRPGTTTA